MELGGERGPAGDAGFGVEDARDAPVGLGQRVDDEGRGHGVGSVSRIGRDRRQGGAKVRVEDIGIRRKIEREGHGGLGPDGVEDSCLHVGLLWKMTV